MNTPSTTSRTHRRVVAVALALLCAAAPARAQGKVRRQLAQRYGGVLAPDCSNYLLPQLLFPGDSLVVRDGGKALLTGRNVRAVPAYFGATPPPEFEAALTSEIAPGEADGLRVLPQRLGAVRHRRRRAEGDGGAAGGLKGKRVRHCDPNRNAVPGAVPARRDDAAGPAQGCALQARLRPGARSAGQGRLARQARRSGPAGRGEKDRRYRVPGRQRLQEPRLFR
jgi:hypothetical protein